MVSIVSDPNADPHEYESNVTDAKEIATANYIIINGVGYDTWARDAGIGAGIEPYAKVLNIGDLVGVPDGGNPHIWYDPAYMNEAIAQMEKDLISIDPSEASYFEQAVRRPEHLAQRLPGPGRPDKGAVRGRRSSFDGEHLRISGERDRP